MKLMSLPLTLAMVVLPMLWLVSGCNDHGEYVYADRWDYYPYRYGYYDEPNTICLYQPGYIVTDRCDEPKHDHDRVYYSHGKNPNYRDNRNNWYSSDDYRRGWRIRTGTNDDFYRWQKPPYLKAGNGGYTPRKDRDWNDAGRKKTTAGRSEFNRGDWKRSGDDGDRNRGERGNRRFDGGRNLNTGRNWNSASSADKSGRSRPLSSTSQRTGPRSSGGRSGGGRGSRGGGKD